MKNIIILFFLLFWSKFSFGQVERISFMVDSLRFMKVDTLDCSADLYWRIISKGKDAIPFLIEKLTDTTQTDVRFHCKRTPLNIGEIAHFALVNIASFPPYAMGVGQFDVFHMDNQGLNCWDFYEFLFMNANKNAYQQAVKAWYTKEALNYKKVKIEKKSQTLCQRNYGITTYYRWKK